MITSDSTVTAPVSEMSSKPTESVSSSSSSATEAVSFSSSTSPATEPVVSSETASTGQLAPDSHLCDMCDFIGVSSVGLKIHKGRKHESIPQIDGESCSARNTDCWWEMHKKHRLKIYKTFMDVLSDIAEANLSKEEKITEREYVTSVRKEALGSNFIYCPPWKTD